MNEPAPIYVRFEAVVLDLLIRTARFPKSNRHTFGTRTDNLALDALERLAAASFAERNRKRILLCEVDELLLRLRVNVRLAHARRFLDNKSYEFISVGVDEVGRMLAGWRKQVA